MPCSTVKLSFSRRAFLVCITAATFYAVSPRLQASDLSDGVSDSPDGNAASRIDINSASAEAIAEVLPGIGPVKAQAIVAFRQINGAFVSPDSLLGVKGIGQRTLEKIEPYLRIGSAANDQRRRDDARSQREEEQYRLSRILSIVREDRRRVLNRLRTQSGNEP